MLRDLSKDIQRLNELRTAAPDGRDQATIRLYSDNSKVLKQAGETWQQMKDILMKDESKHRLDDKQLADRKKIMTILAKEIQDLSNKNAHVKGPRETAEQKTLRGRQEDRARKRREEKTKREERRKRREGKDGDTDKKNEPDIEILDEEMRPVQPISEQEQKFFDRVDEAKAEQDQMLDEIMKGMGDLKNIAIDMNMSIKTTEAMVEEIGDKMDGTIANFKTANKRLQEILEESGGLSRWCPMLICLIILIALVGYMFQMLK